MISFKAKKLIPAEFRKLAKCHRPGVNSVTVTKERPPGSGGLYGTSGTME